MDARRILQTGIVGASVAVAAIAMTSATGSAQTPGDPCPKEDEVTFSPSPAPAATPAPDAPAGEENDEAERDLDAALVVEDPEGVVIRFGKDRDPMTRKFFLALPDRSKAKLPPVDTKLRVRQRPLEREESDNVIQDDSYVANAHVTGEREVTLTVCVDPQVHPGTYKGLVTLEHPEMRSVVVPVEVTLQFPHWFWLALGVGVVVGIAAPLYVWAARQRGTTTGPENVLLSRSALKDLRSWLLSNFIALSVATIAGTSAFLANYWYDPSWGAEAPKDWFTLVGAVFTAFTTGMLTGTAAPRTGSAPAPEPETPPAPS